MEVKTARDEGGEKREIGLVCLLSCRSNVLSAGSHYPLMFWASQIMELPSWRSGSLGSCGRCGPGGRQGHPYSRIWRVQGKERIKGKVSENISETLTASILSILYLHTPEAFSHTLVVPHCSLFIP